MNAIDPTKTYRTSDGKSVRILAVDLPGPWPVAVLVSGDNLVTQLTSFGHKVRQDVMEPFIIEEKPRIKRDFWINIYASGAASFHNTKEEAETIRCIVRKHVAIDAEEGEGLE